MKLRQSSIGLLLFLLVMMSRTLGSFAMAAEFDPIANAPICYHQGAADEAPKDAGAPLVDHQKCALDCCQVFVTAPDIGANPAAIIIERRIVWLQSIPSLSAKSRDFSYTARGPPTLS